MVGNVQAIQSTGQVADRILTQNPGISNIKFAALLDSAMSRQEDVDRGRVGQPTRSKGNNRGSSTSGGPRWSDLTEMEQDFAKTFVDSGAAKTRSEAIQMLADTGALEIQE